MIKEIFNQTGTSMVCWPIMQEKYQSLDCKGTCDAKTKTGGPNGSIRDKEEYMHGANISLKIATDLCEEVKAKHLTVTYADLYQLAGFVAVPTIGFVLGRKDSNESPNEGRLPDAKQVAQAICLMICQSLYPKQAPRIQRHDCQHPSDSVLIVGMYDLYHAKAES